MVIVLFEKDPESVPVELHGMCVDVITAREILNEAHQKQPRTRG